MYSQNFLIKMLLLLQTVLPLKTNNLDHSLIPLVVFNDFIPSHDKDEKVSNRSNNNK